MKANHLFSNGPKAFLAAVFLSITVAACGSSNNGDLFYVSLGDSLSVGIQPDANGDEHTTDQGYADQLFAELQPNNPNLQLMKFGCPGETTTSMIVGGKCNYDQGSQLNEAVKFIVDHQDQIFLVTIDIGVNDVLSSGCINQQTFMVDQACLTQVFQEIGQSNLPLILTKLAEALNDTTPVIGMNYYNTFLATWLVPGGPQGQAIAMGTAQLQTAFNQQVLGAAYAAFGVPVADVAATFKSDDFTDMVPFPPPFNSVPINVALLCKWTYMCVPPPQGPNIHANPDGYKAIADTFFGTLQAIGVLQ